jgi:hypothetical protein
VALVDLMVTDLASLWPPASVAGVAARLLCGGPILVEHQIDVTNHAGIVHSTVPSPQGRNQVCENEVAPYSSPLVSWVMHTPQLY